MTEKGHLTSSMTHQRAAPEYYQIESIKFQYAEFRENTNTKSKTRHLVVFSGCLSIAAELFLLVPGSLGKQARLWVSLSLSSSLTWATKSLLHPVFVPLSGQWSGLSVCEGSSLANFPVCIFWDLHGPCISWWLFAGYRTSVTPPGFLKITLFFYSQSISCPP